MKNGIWIVVALIILLLGFTLWSQNKENNKPTDIEDGVNNNSVSDGILELEYPSDFGLAVTPEQVLVRPYIPPCREGFSYCLYYNGKEFEGTNFESAGISITKRDQYHSEQECLYTSPEDYPALGPSSANNVNYSASVFSPIGDAGAGHFASGEIYRVYVGGACREIETRIGETQFSNYEPGAVQQFIGEDRDAVYQKFNYILNSLRIASSSEIIKLPASEN